MPDKKILQDLVEAELNLQDARLRMEDYRRKFIQAETDLIEAKLAKERLQEELRVLRLRTPTYELDHREKDIARFKEALPELLKKDKWNA